jgi:hypothetical protein
MPADFDDQLFARYQWSANNPTTRVTGTGLGLPMARQIVEMHGGRIWFESKAGAGSEFHFSVPMESTASPPRCASRASSCGAHGLSLRRGVTSDQLAGTCGRVRRHVDGVHLEQDADQLSVRRRDRNVFQ